jgi:hypothetical protein
MQNLGESTVMKIIFALIVSMFLAVGCAAPRQMSSVANLGAPITTTPVVHQLHVIHTYEKRPGGEESSIAPGLIALIPLVPYGTQKFAPEFCYLNDGSSYGKYPYNFKKDLSITVAKDLQTAGIANSVDYVPLYKMQQDDLPPGSRVELFLNDAAWTRRCTAYGLSIAGIVPWMLGFPVSYGHTNLAFEAVVYAPNGQELGRHLFEARVNTAEWLYAPGPFSPLLRKLPLAYEEISPKLRAFVKDCLLKFQH